MQAKFYLNTPSKADSYIYLVIWHAGIKFQWTTGERLQTRFWNSKNQNIKKSFVGYERLNTMLDKMSNDAVDFLRLEKTEGRVPTKKQFTAHMNQRFARGRVQSESDFVEYAKQFISEKEKSNQRASSTIKKYKDVLKVLEKYLKEKGIETLSFEAFNLDFFYQFTDWLFSTKTQYGNLTKTNTVAKIITTLKAFKNDALERGITKDKSHKTRLFKIKEKNSDEVFFTVDELVRLYHFDFSGNTRLERVRDAHIIESFLGVRFSDFSRISVEHFVVINGVQHIQIRTQKSRFKTEIIIPIHPVVKAIFEKYSGELPSKISFQRMNDYIKEIFEVAGFTEEIIVIDDEGGKEVELKMRRCDMVTTHTARRNFITNALAASVPIPDIMKITGIKQIKTLMRYDRSSNLQAAERVSKSTFFDGTAFLKKVL